MLEVADIFRLHGPQYRAKFSARMLPSHRRAMQDIETCRTEALGGQVYFCHQCQEQRYSYHSCKNRHCPKCQNEQANDWLAQQKQLLLPVPHFLVTFTLPAELRTLARSHQKTIYNLLFRASSAALQQLAQDPRFVGGRLGMVGVLHTWTRQLLYHPHVHYIVTGGGLTADDRWRAAGAARLSALRRAAHPARAAPSQRSRPMKLQPLAMVVFLLSPATAAHCSRRHRRTLSATKKTSLNGWLPLPYAQQDAQQHFHPGSFPSRLPTFPLASLPSLDYSNSK